MEENELRGVLRDKTEKMLKDILRDEPMREEFTFKKLAWGFKKKDTSEKLPYSIKKFNMKPGIRTMTRAQPWVDGLSLIHI